MRPTRAPLAFYDLKPDPRSFLEEVIAGLSQPQKTLSPKFFYDERGSALFEEICGLAEYYPTRTELALMQARGAEMAALLGRGSVLIEFGSGLGLKTFELIEHLEPAAYLPIDIAAAQLRSFAQALTARFSGLPVVAVCADYSRPFSLPGMDRFGSRRRVAYFPGSTIGNFTVDEARVFLQRARTLVGSGGGMLVGVDLKKDVALLHAAYNDAKGVTAAFNLNLLMRINRELNADFDLAAFRHHAYYDMRLGRIEMHLVSLVEQTATVAGRAFHFRRDETIHTENSYKYSVAEFQALAGEAGFQAARHWVDPARLFAVHYLCVP